MKGFSVVINMNILHYSLGFPPNRTGGLVKYSNDLIFSQSIMGHQIVYLYPGKYEYFKKTNIKYIGKNNDGITLYRIDNGLPLPLKKGIRTPKDFMRTAPDDLYLDFLKKFNFDVIHVHTLMGIHKEFFEAAKILNIPVVFTSHDYFGLTIEPTFFYDGVSYHDKNSFDIWQKIANNALSTYQLRLFQLSHYHAIRTIKNGVNHILSYTKKDDSYDLKREANMNQVLAEEKNDYSDWRNLNKYYQYIFSLISKFHFNSRVALDVFKRNLQFEITNYSVIPISNNSINTRIFVKKNVNVVKIAYIGPDEEYKGFYDFLKLVNYLDHSSFGFHTYGYTPSKPIYGVEQHGLYSKDDIDKVFNSFDVLIVPSKWKETFGFITLEALSYNKVVFTSQNVGSRDLLSKENVFFNIEDLVKKLKKLDINNYNNEMKEEYLMENHCKKIEEFYTS